MTEATTRKELSGIKRQALDAFSRQVNPQKARLLKSAGLDILEGRREGPCERNLTVEECPRVRNGVLAPCAGNAPRPCASCRP